MTTQLQSSEKPLLNADQLDQLYRLCLSDTAAFEKEMCKLTKKQVCQASSLLAQYSVQKEKKAAKVRVGAVINDNDDPNTRLAYKEVVGAKMIANAVSAGTRMLHEQEKILADPSKLKCRQAARVKDINDHMDALKAKINLDKVWEAEFPASAADGKKRSRDDAPKSKKLGRGATRDVDLCNGGDDDAALQSMFDVKKAEILAATEQFIDNHYQLRFGVDARRMRLAREKDRSQRKRKKSKQHEEQDENDQIEEHSSE